MSQPVDFYGNTSKGGYLTGGSPFGNTGDSPGGLGRKNAFAQSIRRITVKQFNQATQAHPDAEWMFETNELGHVVIVAHVISVQKQTMNCVYMLSDGTGSLEARYWSDSINQDDEDSQDQIKPNTFVQATGTIRNYGQKKYFNATQIQPVRHGHEVFFHQLDAMAIQLFFDRRSSGTSMNAQASDASGGQSVSAYSAAQVHQSGVQDQYAHLPPVPRSIAHFMLKQAPRPEGVHVSAIAKAVGADAESIERALETLMDDGIIFSTINETHFQISR